MADNPGYQQSLVGWQATIKPRLVMNTWAERRTIALADMISKYGVKRCVQFGYSQVEINAALHWGLS
jgi:hypothetical protein